MTEEVAAAQEAAPEAVPETPEVEQGEQPETPEQTAEKSRSKERREREKAQKERLRSEREAALEKAAAAEAKRARILDAGSAPAEPQEKDFADYTEYVAAKAVWKHAKGLTEREASAISEEAQEAKRVAQELEEQERAIAFQAFDEARKDARARYSDYDAVVGQPGLFPKNTFLPDLVLHSDYPADVAYEIAKDRNLHDALLKAGPIQASRIIGRIEAQLSLPKPRTQTTAPPPVTPVKAGAAPRPDPANMSYAEYVEARKSGRLR